MLVTLEEAKVYLRQDSSDDDQLITSYILSAEQLVKDISRLDEDGFEKNAATVRIAALYAIGYLYEHREQADHHDLVLTLRALHFGVREAKF